jgi:hypothetical protein
MAGELIWEDKGILVKHSGTVTDEEVRELNDRMYGDIRFDSINYQIADYTEVTKNLITPQDAKVVGKLDRASSMWTSKKMKLAIVSQDENFFPVVETYFSEFAETEWEGRIFPTLVEAYAWVKSD